MIVPATDSTARASGAQLATRRLGRALITARARRPRTTTPLTRSAGRGDGVVVVADAQTGIAAAPDARGSIVRPAARFALSVAAPATCGGGLIPLAAGVAAATAIGRCGRRRAHAPAVERRASRTGASWPVLVMRCAPAGGDVVVIGGRQRAHAGRGVSG